MSHGCNCAQPYANRGLIAEVHANLGWIGMTPLKPTPNWDGYKGAWIAKIAGIAGIANIGNLKTQIQSVKNVEGAVGQELSQAWGEVG